MLFALGDRKLLKYKVAREAGTTRCDITACGRCAKARKHTIRWHISATCRHGLRKLVFNGGEASLLCHGLDNPGKTRIEVETDRQLTLKVSLEGRSCPEPRVYELDAGRHAMTP